MYFKFISIINLCITAHHQEVDSSWNVMAHGDAREGKWRGNWRMEWVASTLHTTSEHGLSSITTADAQTSAVSSRLNWRPRGFKWTRPFRRKTKCGFCACAITFQLAATSLYMALLVCVMRLCWLPVGGIGMAVSLLETARGWLLKYIESEQCILLVLTVRIACSCLIAWDNSTPAVQIFVKIGIGDFYGIMLTQLISG